MLIKKKTLEKKSKKPMVKQKAKKILKRRDGGNSGTGTYFNYKNHLKNLHFIIIIY